MSIKWQFGRLRAALFYAGNIFPGFMMSCGSSARLIRLENSDCRLSSSSLAVCRMVARSGPGFSPFAADFTIEEATTEELVAAITGASDNVVSERAARRTREEGPADG